MIKKNAPQITIYGEVDGKGNYGVEFKSKFPNKLFEGICDMKIDGVKFENVSIENSGYADIKNIETNSKIINKNSGYLKIENAKIFLKNKRVIFGSLLALITLIGFILQLIDFNWDKIF
jgi:hypothetical protein